jgi:hypothetical protein
MRSLRQSPLPSPRPGILRPKKHEGANTLMGGGPENAVTPSLCIALHVMPTIGQNIGA